MIDQSVHPEASRWGGWSWREPSRGEHFRRCSYCGSVSPEDLVAEPTWRAEWADRKYGWPHKFYVDIANREPGQLFVVSSTWSEEPPRPLVKEQEWVAVGDLSPDQLAVAQRDGYLVPAPDGRLTKYLTFGTHAAHFGKFYSIHLADAGLDPAVKEATERRCGLAFEFLADGRVSWRPASPEVSHG